MSNHYQLIKIFDSVRDIPYLIPLSTNDNDDCCNGKHQKLYKLLKQEGYDVRYRICFFDWRDLNLPATLLQKLDSGEGSHLYLEVKLGNTWKTLDASWDSELKKVLPVNNWDGKSNTKIAVIPIKTLSPEKSDAFLEKSSQETNKSQQDMFIPAFNEWLEQQRSK